MEFLEEFDEIIALGSGLDAEHILYKASDEEVYEFAETLALSARYHFSKSENQNKNFSFVANSSLSGGKHPCSEIPCRSKKLDNLISFSAIYADEVYIQNPFEEIMISGLEDITDYSRDEIIHGIINYGHLKPLIRKGIIKYAQNEVILCQTHNETIAEPLSTEIIRKQEILYELLCGNLIDRCAVTLDRNESYPFLEVKGPEEFIDHGRAYLRFFYDPPEFVSDFLSIRTPYVFTKEEIIKLELLSYIVAPILRDLSNQEWHSAFFGTSYLCDNATQIALASKLNNDAYTASSTALNNALNHTLPTVNSSNLSNVLKLREQEEEAFTVYRDKLHELLKQTNNWNESEVEEAFRDTVLPEINTIDKKVKDWKVRSRESLKEKLIFGTGAVSIGLYSGMLSPNISQLVAAVGGGAAVTGAVMDINKTFKEKYEARVNDYYFLWQAKN